jgi:hypothetical protein
MDSITKKIINLVPLTLIVVGLLSYNFMSAQWSGPTATAPNNNIEAPVNVSASYQAKLGDLGAVRMRAGQYCDAAGTSCVSASALGGSGLGVGQTWKNVSGSRARNVWYQNTTGQPMYVAIQTNAGASWLMYNTVGSDTGAMQISGQDGSSGTFDNLYGIIPANGYYKLVGATQIAWTELSTP